MTIDASTFRAAADWPHWEEYIGPSTRLQFFITFNYYQKRRLFQWENMELEDTVKGGFFRPPQRICFSRSLRKLPHEAPTFSAMGQLFPGKVERSLECCPRFETQPFQDQDQGAITRKGCLQEVGAHKSSEPQPFEGVDLRQQEACDDKDPGQAHHHSVDIHDQSPPLWFGVPCVQLTDEKAACHPPTQPLPS